MNFAVVKIYFKFNLEFVYIISQVYNKYIYFLFVNIKSIIKILSSINIIFICRYCDFSFRHHINKSSVYLIYVYL